MSLPYIPVPDVASIGLEFTLAGIPCSCVLYAENDSTVTIGNMQTLATAIIDAIDSFQGGPTIFADPNCALETIRMTDLTTSSGPSFDWVTGTSDNLPFTGNAGSAVLSNQDCSVVTWQTTARGRSFRGRSFMPGLPQDALLNGTTIKPVYVTDLSGWWEAIHSGINTAGGGPWAHVVVSRISGGAPRSVGVATPIVTFRMNDYVGSQNRRR